MTAKIATCANACTDCTNGNGWICEGVFDSDTERLVLTDFRCPCRGERCLACEFGAACWATGESYAEPSSVQFWDEGGAEDFERFDD